MCAAKVWHPSQLLRQVVIQWHQKRAWLTGSEIVLEQLGRKDECGGCYGKEAGSTAHDGTFSGWCCFSKSRLGILIMTHKHGLASYIVTRMHQKGCGRSN
mmetsp:Transcript_26974/g.34354  ORF Transcript_26974/g.34354 Transcript_26974/m.34354 type:complete len:100 (+) Transcript_26974:1284-1583(+)